MPNHDYGPWDIGAVKINFCDDLFKRLRQIFDDHDFNYGQFPQYHPQECLLMAKDGPQRPVDHLDQITVEQWRMIETLVAAHEKLLAEKSAISDLDNDKPAAWNDATFRYVKALKSSYNDIKARLERRAEDPRLARWYDRYPVGHHATVGCRLRLDDSGTNPPLNMRPEAAIERASGHPTLAILDYLAPARNNPR